MRKFIPINQSTHTMLKLAAAAERKSLTKMAEEILDRGLSQKVNQVHQQITRLQEPTAQPA